MDGPGLPHYGSVLSGDGALFSGAGSHYQAHSYSPMDNTILAVKARILECSGQSSEALALYLDLASCMPDSPFITQGIGRIYAERNELKKAIHYMRMTLALNPDYPQCHYLLGQLYKRSALAGAAGDWKRALEQMILAVKEKDCVSHRMERGDIFFQMSNYRRQLMIFCGCCSGSRKTSWRL